MLKRPTRRSRGVMIVCLHATPLVDLIYLGMWLLAFASYYNLKNATAPYKARQGSFPVPTCFLVLSNP